MFGQHSGFFFDLEHQFAGGSKNKQTGTAVGQILNRIAQHAGQTGEQEGCRFSGTGLGLTQAIPTCENFRKDAGLNGRAVLVAQIGHSAYQFYRQIEVAKTLFPFFRFHHIAGGVPFAGLRFGAGERKAFSATVAGAPVSVPSTFPTAFFAAAFIPAAALALSGRTISFSGLCFCRAFFRAFTSFGSLFIPFTGFAGTAAATAATLGGTRALFLFRAVTGTPFLGFHFAFLLSFFEDLGGLGAGSFFGF